MGIYTIPSPVCREGKRDEVRTLNPNLQAGFCLMRKSFLLCLLVLSCGGPAQPGIERIEDSEKLDLFHQMSLAGIRDGDLLQARLAFTSGSSTLTMRMLFRVGVPTSLERGSYRWAQEDQVIEGSITASSVTFLGGQSDRPHLGGVFRLLSSQGIPIYRVTVPTSELARPAPGDADFETISGHLPTPG